MTISNLSKSKISLIRSLNDKKNRYASGLFIVEGDKIINELINSNFTIRQLFINPDISNIIVKNNIETICLRASDMKKISNFTSDSSSLAVVELQNYEFNINSFKDCICLVIDCIQDPGNFGTIIRICKWFGINNIVCSMDSVDLYNSKVLQASMGSFIGIKVFYMDLIDFINDYRQQFSYPIVGAFIGGQNIYKTNLPHSAMIVVGNESKGISNNIAQYIDLKLTIPPFFDNNNYVESLNLASATAIICSEFKRTQYNTNV